MEGEIQLRSLWHCASYQLSLDLKAKVNIQGHEREKVSEIVSLLWLCQLYRKSTSDLRTPPVIIDCAILG